MRLLVIEDEQRLAYILEQALQNAGFVVDAVSRTSDAWNAFSTMNYDAAIVDLGLPDGDGLHLLARLRAAGSQVPILVLTARDTVENRVHGLDTGADDYMVKPFAMTELIARVKALLRRPGGALGVTLTAGNLAFDTIARNAEVGGKALSLARREMAMLEHLMRRLGRVVPKEMLEEKLYGMGEEIESNTVPVHVHHLRRKLAQARASAEIHTVRGVGYLLVELTP